MLADRIIQSTH